MASIARDCRRNKIMGGTRLPLAWVWAVSIIAVWLTVAMKLRQPPLAAQPSQALEMFGAFKGVSLTLGTAWKLIASQWLHVHAGHMLLNATTIGLVGTALQRNARPTAVASIGISGGALAQLVAAVAEPNGFVSGASQAAMVLAGAALITVAPRRIGWWFAVTAIAVAATLDLSTSPAIKPGHLAGLLVGLAASPALRRRTV